MAEAFATDTTKSLLRKLGSSAVPSAWGLEADLSRLEERLSAINTVLSDAEKIQSKNDSIRLWLHDLIEVLYDAEDALDEIECETLRRKVVKTTGSTSRKVRRFFSSSSMIALRLRMGHKIKNIMERLAEISSLKSNFNLNEQTNDGSHVLHEEKDILYRSFESFSGLIGRDEEKERIINLLVEPSRDGYQFIDLILVQFWMAHGLIKSSNPNENLEDVGLRYVHELILKCFFQDYVGLTFSASFKMHDLMHDLASSLARNECSIISSQNHQISKTSRHLSVLDSNSLFDQTLPKYPHKLHHVRSIVFASSLEGLGCKAGFEKCLSEFKHLRSLELMDDSEFEVFPERVGALKHLRYLNFAGNAKMKRLPKSIFKLQSLQAMVVGVGLEELPKDVRYMISLGFLFLVTKQKRLPEGSMKCLTALKELFIGDCEKLDMMTLDEEKERETQRLSLQIVAFGGLPATQALPKQLLHGCTNSLERFMIVDCPNIIELPECISNLKRLQNLQIFHILLILQFLSSFKFISLKTISRSGGLGSNGTPSTLPEKKQDELSLKSLPLVIRGLTI
ncbi:hypothetical protein OIU74_009571 [Salix koriyanagi]|uniref:Rx N-terminal domain-containing protein n=1 Tax=Salix koriyanagi TaxID=2511006 RepID=A0A9Q0TSK4_9ROSI|nr:hypothetical protein OIU74_009571 [Salix koriyanagi]